MSVSKETFLIVGCDIKDCLTEKFEDWYWSDEGERYHCFQKECEIQIIDDGMNGDYTYIGFILAYVDGDDYGDLQKEIKASDFNFYKPYISYEVINLTDIGVLDRNKIKDLTIKMILFNHYS